MTPEQYADLCARLDRIELCVTKLDQFTSGIMDMLSQSVSGGGGLGGMAIRTMMPRNADGTPRIPL